MSGLVLNFLAASALTTAAPDPSALDVMWRTPSVDAAGSMPIGNGEVVLNVWVEADTGDLLFYVARTDALSEISRFLKLGRVRVHFEPSPWKHAADFRQRLNLKDGRIEVSGGGTDLRLFVDSRADVVHVTGRSVKPVSVRATVENWRNRARALPPEEERSAWTVHDGPFPKVESADVFVPETDRLVWYHRNETSVVPRIWENQSLKGLPGTFDPILHRTFGGLLEGEGFVRADDRGLVREGKSFALRLATACAQTRTVKDWRAKLATVAAGSNDANPAQRRTAKWWKEFWNRSWVRVEGDRAPAEVPQNAHPFRIGVDSVGGNVFPGKFLMVSWWDHPIRPNRIAELAATQGLVPGEATAHWSAPPTPMPKAGDQEVKSLGGFTVDAWIRPEGNRPGRIVDKLTAGANDGFLFDTHPGDALRLIVGDLTLVAPKCVAPNEWQHVAATYDAATGEAAIYRNGKRVAHRPADEGSPVTRGYTLQRFVQACQGRGAFPAKFNGGFYSVEPAAMGMPFDADWRQWGDCFWFQNQRHLVHPMFAAGDAEQSDPFFRLYESAVPLAESRTRRYHGAEGAYFPETMTAFGTYSGGDYGWNREGLQPKDVQCPWWDDAWNQGPELVALMLDRWDYTRDRKFLAERVLPMAETTLRYFDTRFRKDAQGRIVLDPTQVVETYWTDVVNDMPTVAGLIEVTERLTVLPANLVPKDKAAFFARMRAACPELPLEEGESGRELAPAQKYDPRTSNVENGELYGVWPFRLVQLGRPQRIEEARRAYAHRKNRLDTGWGYDGNVAALLGMTEEAARILRVKAANSHPAYRWPATWGPNFDWLPDQNHGGNLLNTANLMLLQADSIEAGGAIRLLPAWPQGWDVDFKLHAPGRTTVRCVYRAGEIVELEITPASRAKDVVLPPFVRRDRPVASAHNGGSMLLAGKKGLVFGVTNRHSIGWSIAQAASDHGAKVALGVQNERMLGGVQRLLEEDPRYETVLVDFSDDEQLVGLPDQVRALYPDGVDFIVHSVAYALREELEGQFIHTSREGFRIALDVSAYSFVALCRTLEPLMRDDASIVCLSYLGSTRAAGNYNVMGVAKAALESSARYLALDLGGRGIRVNVLSPGPINTVSARGVKGLSAKIEHVRERAPLKRPAEQAEVAGSAVYYLSDLSRGVTGQIVFIDGGYNMVGP
ncbi:MAG: SDR family oxidoreductase [Fimbriimonadaceae bacterium]|nr:SDR family oxidoreductase [Fimbriimonadaceae bacterium]